MMFKEIFMWTICSLLHAKRNIRPFPYLVGDSAEIAIS